MEQELSASQKMNQDIGTEIRHARIQKQWTIKKLAEKTGYSTSAISQVENNRMQPSPNFLTVLAKALDMNLSDLMELQSYSTNFLFSVVKTNYARREYAKALEYILQMEQNPDFQFMSVSKKQYTSIVKVESFYRLGQKESALALARELDEDSGRFDEELLPLLFKVIGNIYHLENDYINAMHYYYRAYKVVEQVGTDQSMLGDITYNLGLVSSKLNKRRDAEAFLRIAFGIYEKGQNVMHRADTIYLLGIATKNENYLRQAQVLYEELGQVRMANFVQQKYLYDHMAKLDYLGAVRELGDIASRFVHELNDLDSSLFTKSRQIRVAVENADYDLARQIVYEVQNIEDRNPEILGHYFCSLGFLEFHAHNYELAISHYQASISYFDLAKQVDEKALSMQMISKVYAKMDMMQDAYQYSSNAFELLQKKEEY